MFNVLDTVVLTRDAPDAGLRRGDLGAIVDGLRTRRARGRVRRSLGSNPGAGYAERC